MQELQLTHMAKMEELRLMGIQLGVETQLGQMDAQLKAVQTQIDQYRVVNEAQEKIVEELRLGVQKRDQELNGQAKEQQPIVINNIIPPKPPTVIKTAAIRDPLTDVLLGAESVVTPETPPEI